MRVINLFMEIRQNKLLFTSTISTRPDIETFMDIITCSSRPNCCQNAGTEAPHLSLPASAKIQVKNLSPGLSS